MSEGEGWEGEDEYVTERCVEACAGAVQSKVVISAQRLVCLASRYLAGAMTVEGGDGRGYSISCVPVVV